MYDIIYTTSSIKNNQSKREFELISNRFPFARYVECETLIEQYFRAAKEANTNFFFVVNEGSEIHSSFNFKYETFDVDKSWVTRFKNTDGLFVAGVYLFHKSGFNQTLKNGANFINDFGALGIKDVDIIASKKDTVKADIFFLMRNKFDWSINERFAKLKLKYPTIEKIENVDVIEGHFAACAKSNTDFFYVIDENFEPLNFNFNYKISNIDKHWVTRFKNSDETFTHGIRVIHKSVSKQQITDTKKVDFINNFGEICINDVDTIVCEKTTITPDIFLFTHNHFRWKDVAKKINVPIKVIEGDNIIKLHEQADEQSSTSMFYVIDAPFVPDDNFNFTQNVLLENKNWVTRFSCEKQMTSGMRLLPKNVTKQKMSKDVDFINNFGKFGVKDVRHNAATKYNKQLDIMFLDSSESFANDNFNALKSRFGDRVKRVSNIKGFWQAHKAASYLSSTHLFYVVDADAVPLNSFKFDLEPNVWDQNYVYVWNSYCELTGLTYGNGGIKLLNKDFFTSEPINYVDLTTSISSSISKGLKIIDIVASKNIFFEDAFMAWRGAFRECAKLKSGMIHGSIEEENQERLEAWVNIKVDHPNKEYVEKGARDGIKYAESKSDLSKINDYEWLLMYYNNSL